MSDPMVVEETVTEAVGAEPPKRRRKPDAAVIEGQAVEVAAEAEPEEAPPPKEPHPMIGVIGVHSGIPEDEYHADPDSISVSGIKTFKEAPAKYRYGERKERDAQRVGSLVHRCTLEPGRVEAEYQIREHENLSTKVAKEEIKAIKAAGLIPIKRDELTMAMTLGDRLRNHPTAGQLLEGLSPERDFELSAYAMDDETGLMKRCRFDVLNRRLRTVADIKTTISAEPVAFAKQAANLKYPWASSWYLEIAAQLELDVETFAFIAIEKEPPYLVGCYEVEQTDLEWARKQLREQLDRFAECKRTDNWPGYSPFLERLVLPAWAIRDAS